METSEHLPGLDPPGADSDKDPKGQPPAPTANPDLQALIEQAVAKVRDEVKGELTTYQQQVQQYKQQWEGLQRAINPQQSQPSEQDLDTQWLMSPTKAMQGLEERIVNRLTTAYQQQETAKSFWRDFYAENEDLRGMEWMVETLLRGNQRLLAINNPTELSKELASQARQQALQIARGFGGGQGGRQPHIEGGGAQRTHTRTRQQDEEPHVPVSPLERLRAMKAEQRKRGA